MGQMLGNQGQLTDQSIAGLVLDQDFLHTLFPGDYLWSDSSWARE